ncbi:MAG: response regulator [Terrimicrobiaceae bacterium]|nr:response regulator [Terrimicrobiaceae bacterium]
MSVPPPTNISQAFAPAREAVLIWVVLTTFLVICVWMGGQYGERKLSDAIRSDAVNAARAAMLGLDPALHDRIARQEKMWSDPHKKALATLLAFHKQYPDVSRVRTFMLHGGKVVVILDTETIAGDVGMKRPVDPMELRTPLPETDPAYAVVEKVLKSRDPAATEHSSYDGYRHWRPGVVPFGKDAAIEADLTSITQESTLMSLQMWVGTGIGIAVIACGVVALIYFNLRTAHLLSKTTGDEARRSEDWLEQRNSRLVEALGQAVLHRDLSADYLLWGGDTRRLLGTAIDQMPMDFEAWLARIHPEDAIRVGTAASRATEDQRTYEIEYRVRHENGEWRWFRERGVVSFRLDEDKLRPSSVDCVLDDISQNKHGAEQLASLALIASHTDNAVCLTNEAGCIQWTNSTFQRLTGMESVESGGKAFTDLFVSAPGQPALVGLFDDAIAGHGGRAEIQLIHRNGSAYRANLELQPLRDDTGAINRLVAIQSDITAAKEFETRLVRAKEDAESADRAKSEFLAVMSHEIRTPLNAVLGFTRLLLDTQLTVQQRDYIDTIRSSGDSLLHLLNDILDFSKMDAGGMQLEQVPFDLRGCIEDTLDVLIAPASTRGLDLYADIGLETPLAVVGDRGRLRQVLLNLTGNAVKFTERGEVAISVRPLPVQLPAANHHPATVRLRFEVRDTGSGINADQQAQLFRPFTQADSSATRKHGGTGLGLAISKRLITLMDGEIGLESVTGKGSTFWFEIPLAVASHQPAPPPGLHALEGLRVLVVEKNPGQRRVLVDQLTAWDLHVEAFGRGRDAIFAAEHRRFDVAILDSAPPDIDGLGLVDRLRHSPRRNVGSIILAGPPGQLPVATHGPFDALHRLVKPIHAVVLAETLLRVGTRATSRPAVPRPAIFPSAAAPARATPPAREVARTRPAEPAIPVRRILVADDNAINRKLLKKILDGMNYTATLVSNGLECVDAVKAGSFDAILMDIQMPEMDGLTAARAIRELGSEIPIIALTADAMPDDRARCLAAGMNDYLQKPLRPDALEAALDRAAAAAVA